MAGVALVDVAESNRLDSELLYQIVILRYMRQPKIIVILNNSGQTGLK
jgi:hypothetical protein